MKESDISKKAAWVSLAAFIALGFILGAVTLGQGNLSRGLLGFGSAAFLLVPFFFKRMGMAHPYKLYTVLFLFCILAYDIGCVYQRFDIWPYFDKISHFLSGIVFTILGYCLYFWAVRPKPQSIRQGWLVSTTYALFFSAFVSVVWEIFEFSGFLLTGHDSQHHLTTGVFDTMEDLISCLVGSFLSAGAFLLHTVAGKAKLLTPAVSEEFLAVCSRSKNGVLFREK